MTYEYYARPVVRMNGIIICEPKLDFAVGVEEYNANAHLIAAAPELLAACERALVLCRKWRGGSEELDIGQLLIAAIAKATGHDS